MSLNGKQALLKEILLGQFGPIISPNHPDIPLLEGLEAEGEIDLKRISVAGPEGAEEAAIEILVSD